MPSLCRPLVLLGMVSLASACAHYAEVLKNQLDPWIGRHPDKLVEIWGAPSSVYVMESGVKVLSYTNERQVLRSVGAGYSNWRWGSYSYSESCKINFFTDDKQKKIDRFTKTGDDGSCVELMRDMPAL